MEKIWLVNMSMEFTEIESNHVFVGIVVNRGDRSRVLAGCPWLFDNYLFVLKLFDSSM